uniref:Tetraspanin n=1 Tax=Myxobolus squamalis TaxID=59785 RepID=A0A6B2G164_MYXSQ
MDCRKGFCFILISIIPLSLGVGLAFIGGLSFRTSSSACSIYKAPLSTIGMSSGVAIIAVIIIGWIAFCSKSRGVHFTFVALAVLLTCALIGFMIVAYIYRSQARGIATDCVQKAIESFEQRTSNTTFLDILHDQLQCCGANGSSDWALKNLSIPISCCKKEVRGEKCADNPANLFTDGCVKKVESVYVSSSPYILAFLALVIITFIVLSSISCMSGQQAGKEELQEL